jgi:hypothetical protein
MINRSISMARKVFGLFVDEGSLALSILVWIFVLQVAAPIASIAQTWAAPVLFLGWAVILTENLLRASRQPLPSVRGLSQTP